MIESLDSVISLAMNHSSYKNIDRVYYRNIYKITIEVS